MSLKIFILTFVILIHAGCKKSEEKPPTRVGDGVIGSYTGYYGSQQITVGVYKLSTQKYAMRKITPAPFPDFEFQYKLDLFGLFAYDVLPQAMIVTDSSNASYNDVQRNFGFTIQLQNGTKFSYSGFK